MGDIFLIIVILPIVISALVPRRWLPAWALFIAQVVVVLLIDSNRAQCGSCGSPGDSFGMAFFVLEVFIISVVLIRRIFPKHDRQALVLSLSESDGPTAAFVALLAGGSSVALTALWVQGWNFAMDSGLATHLAVLVFAICWFVITPMGWASRPARWRVLTLHPSNVFRFTGALVIGGTLVWSLQVETQAVAAGELVSQGQPYCLLTAGPHGVRLVRNRFDLTGFAMQVDRGSTRHAQLATGNEKEPKWHYWSYRKGAFEPEFMGGVLTCDLQPKFADKLAWFGAKQTGSRDLHFWLGGGQWAVPQAFHGVAIDKPSTLSFYAQGRDFSSLGNGLIREGYTNWEQLKRQVDVTLCTPEKLHVWHTVSDQNYKVEPVGTEYGLVKQQISSLRGGPSRIQHIEYGRSGAAVTWLQCDEHGGDCRHAFAREGMVVSFMHSKEDFSAWKSLQDALWLRVKSFSVVWPEQPLRACASR